MEQNRSIIDANELDYLREEFGRHKLIPSQYEAAILTALSYYPELKGTRIVFRPKKNHPVPCSTRPSLRSLLKASGDRLYSVVICEETGSPLQDVLMKNLPLRAQLGMIGHELAHIVRFNACSRLQLAALLLRHIAPPVKRRLERAADQVTIDHGLGNELYALAAYIRRSPAYLQEHRAISGHYLKPAEIRESLP